MRRITYLFCLLLLGLAVFARPALAQDCFDYTSLPIPLDLFADVGEIERLAVDGDRFCYAAEGPGEDDLRLVLVAAAPGSAPAVLGEVVVGKGMPTSLDMDGDRVVVGYIHNSAFRGWLLVDFTDPAAPVVRIDVPCDTPVPGIALEGDLLCAIVLNEGFVFYDVSDLDAPVIVTTLSGAATGSAVVESAGRWYMSGLASHVSFLRIYDLSVPTAPVLSGEILDYWEWDFGGRYLSLSVRDGLIAVRHEFHRYDWDTRETDYSYRLKFFDATDPDDAIVPTGSFGLPWTAMSTPALGGDVAYVSADGLLHYYAQTGGSWAEIHGLGLETTAPPVAVCGGRIICAAAARLLEVAPYPAAAVHVVATLPINASSSMDLEVTDTHLFVSCLYESSDTMGDHNRGAVRILDLADPAEPLDVGSVSGFTGFPLGDIVVHDEYLYSNVGTIHWPTGEDPDMMTANLTTDSVVQGDVLFAPRTLSLDVYDVSDDTAPALTAQFVLPDAVEAVAVGPGLLCVAGHRLYVYDLVDPLTPVAEGSVDLMSYARRADMEGDRLCLVGTGGLAVYDLSDPLTPVLAGSADLGSCLDVTIKGDVAYIAAGAQGLIVADVSDPTTITVLGRYHGGSDALRVESSHGLVYLLDLHDLHILRPDCLGVVAIDTPWVPELPPVEDRTALAAPVPNPFNPSTELSFTLERPGPVSLEIHDAAGRLVRTLVDEPCAEGPHTVQWDGRDATGRVAAAGVYFAHLRADGKAETRKLALVK